MMISETSAVRVYETPARYVVPPRARNWVRIGALLAFSLALVPVAYVTLGLFVQAEQVDAQVENPAIDDPLDRSLAAPGGSPAEMPAQADGKQPDDTQPAGQEAPQ